MDKSMKGIVIERAVPSSVLDVYALLKESVKEGIWPDTGLSPNKNTIKEYYFDLLAELQNPFELVFLARRGRTYWGFVHVAMVPRPIEKCYVMYIKAIYVNHKKRKLGIGRSLLKRVNEEALKLGIKRVEFMCEDKLVDYWVKAVPSKKVLNYMVWSVNS